MKKVILILSVAATQLVGCSKNQEENSGEISYVNGNNTNTFTINAKASLSSPGGVPTLNIVGYKSTGVTENFSITIKKAAGITPGAYNENDPANIVTVSHYFPGSNIIGIPPFSAVNFNSSSDPFIISISEVSGNWAKGAFTGELRASPTVPPIRVTNGLFNVKF